MNFFQLWLLGLTNPSRASNQLRKKPAPSWDLWAILMRFVPTSLASMVALLLLNRTPFVSSYLKFVSTEHYFRAEIFILPFFGLATWQTRGCMPCTASYNNYKEFEIESPVDW